MFFFNLKKKNLVIDFHWICFIMKICYFLCSSINPILGKNLVSEIHAKMASANQIAGSLTLPFLQNKSMTQPNSLHVDTNLQKLIVDWKLWLDMVKYGCGQSGLSQEWADGINWVFACWHKVTHKLKGDQKLLGWAWSRMGEVSLVIQL